MKNVAPGVYFAACLSYDTMQCFNVFTYSMWGLFCGCMFIQFNICSRYCQCFFSKKMFRGTLSLTQENHNFIVQIGKNKSSQWTKFGVCLAGILTF
jgi:hypothetical protein